SVFRHNVSDWIGSDTLWRCTLVQYLPVFQFKADYLLSHLHGRMFMQRCPLCSASSSVFFYSQERLIQHLNIRHKDSYGNILYKCVKCPGVSYENYEGLRTHIRRKHGDTEKLSSSSNDSLGEAGINPFSDVEIQNVLHIAAESNLKLEGVLQLKAASLLINLKEVHCATQPVIQQVISGVGTLFDTFLDIVQSKFSKDPHDVLSTEEAVSCIETLRGQSLFAGIETATELERYMDKEQGLVKPFKVSVARKKVVKNCIVKEIDVDFGYVVPFLPSLQKILSCSEILDCIDNPAPVRSGVFTSPLDSYFYQNHPCVKSDPKTLAIGIYSDGVDLTDSASSKSGVHADTFIYFVIYNINAKLRSSRRSIFLLSIVKSSVLKKHGFKEFLKDFVEGMNKLSSPEGVDFLIANKRRNFHAIFICACGDNPASECLGGFKESHFAEKPCRHCFVDKTNLFASFKESDFSLRSMSTHKMQVDEVKQYFSLAPKDREGLVNPSVKYGIKRESVLMEIKGCDVTKCLPQDMMHDTIEGSLKLEIACLLADVVNSKEETLSAINNRISIFSKHFGVNKPSTIEMHYLDQKKLRQTASETLNLAYMLPFVLRKKTTAGLVSVCKEVNLKCFAMRLKLLDYLMSEELTYNDIQIIRKLTQQHHTLFQELYGCAIPKMHFECHLNQVLLFGPPRNFWCFGFEGKHSYFKRLLRIFRCFKDPAGTFARAHQRRMCGLMLLSSKGVSGPFLKSSDSLGAPVNIKLQSLVYRSALLNFYPNIAGDLRLTLYRVALYNGVEYRKSQVVMISKSAELPVFGEIVYLLLHEAKLIFMYKHMITQCHNKFLNAFKLNYCTDTEFGTIAASDLPYHHRIFVIKAVSSIHVIVPCRNFAHSAIS
ncbi:Pyrroline-5-carboxylate reductase ucsG, partial [Frankliniella fusca]